MNIKLNLYTELKNFFFFLLCFEVKKWAEVAQLIG